VIYFLCPSVQGWKYPVYPGNILRTIFGEQLNILFIRPILAERFCGSEHYEVISDPTKKGLQLH